MPDPSPFPPGPEQSQWAPKSNVESGAQLANELRLIQTTKEALDTFTATLNPDGKYSQTPEMRKKVAWSRLDGYRPELMSRADNVVAYNILAGISGGAARDRSDPTPSITASFKAKLDAIKPFAFGEHAQVAKVSKNELLSNGVRHQEWHGVPISIGITQTNRTGLASGDNRSDLTLFRGIDNQWFVHGWNDEVATIPTTGLTLGRAVSAEAVPALKTTIENILEKDDQVSRSHLTLEPQTDGSIKIRDHSTNGSYVVESYYDAQEPPKLSAPVRIRGVRVVEAQPPIDPKPDQPDQLGWFGRRK